MVKNKLSNASGGSLLGANKEGVKTNLLDLKIYNQFPSLYFIL